MITGLFIQLALMVVPALLLVGLLMREGKAREQSGEKKPVKELLLRSPGESLRRKIDDLNEGIDFSLINSIAIGAIVGALFNQNLQAGGSGMVLKMIIYALVFLGAEWWVLAGIYRRIKERTKYRLGLSGELAVGEELNKLMLEGCRVYHDFPGGPDWNIDHIIVAPSGVFAVETKARHKRQGTGKQQSHVVIYTGDALQFPTWTETKPLEQIERNAFQLSKVIEKSAAEKVSVTPLLVLPGWWVEHEASGPKRVFSHKYVQYAILNGPPILTREQIKRICHQIEQKCRDVEL